MTTHLSLVLVAWLAQAPESTPADKLEQAVQAAQKAAEAAQKAAEAAQKAAEAAVASEQPPKEAPKAEAKAADSWKGLVGLGLIALSGNANTLTGTANAAVDKAFGEWAVGLRLNGAYGQTSPQDGGPNQLTAAKAMGTLRGDRKIVDWASIYALGGLETDHIKSVELREYGELGAGIRLFQRMQADLERVYLRLDVAFRYQNESRFQYIGDKTFPTNTGLPGVQMAAPRFGLTFRYALNKDIRFSEEAEVLPNLLGESRTIVNSTTKLAARLTEALSITASDVVNFDSAPVKGKQTTDNALTLGLEAAF